MDKNLKPLLYILLREDIPFGRINRILKENIMNKNHSKTKYSDKHLESKAQGIIDFLKSNLTREEYNKFVLSNDDLNGE